VQIIADYLDDAVTKRLTLLEQADEIEVLADRFQRLGEFGVEQFVHCDPIGSAIHADGLGHLEHVLSCFVYPQVERNGDVRPQVVLADQAILATPVHFQRQQGDFHELLLVDHRIDECTGEVHLRRGGHVVDDQGGALRYLDIERLEQNEESNQDQKKYAHPDQEGHQHCHVHLHLLVCGTRDCFLRV